jgi:hypothetical protein
MRPGPQLPVEPGTGQGPVALDGHGGNAEHGGGLLDRQAPEEAELDELALPGVDRGEPIERHIQRQDVDRRRLGPAVLTHQPHGLAAAPLDRCSRPRVIDEMRRMTRAAIAKK